MTSTRSAHWLIIGPPLGFLLVFFLIPFLFTFKISLAESLIAIPPYSALISQDAAHHWVINANLASYRYLFSDPVYAVSYLYSLKTALSCTLGCLLLGYPAAYAMARAPKPLQPILVLIIMLPFWTSFLLRVYALEDLIRDTGLLNLLLLKVGLIHSPLHLLRTPTGVFIGIMYSYLPFMVLPLYATLEKLDGSLLEAAADLGAKPWQVFRDVTLPLSVPGIFAGSLLVFIPAIGEYVIPDLMGGPSTPMIGKVLWTEFFENHNWPVASAVAVCLMTVVLIPLLLKKLWSLRA